jgi:RNA polymerase sigma-70 factor (TIGR02943 family)
MHIDNNKIATDKILLINPQQWVVKYADYLYRYAITRVNDEESAKDLVQETFLAALERVEKFEGRSSEQTWLTAILKNKIIDVYRKKSSGLLERPEVADSKTDHDNFFETENGHWKLKQQPQAFGIEVYDPLIGKELNNILEKCMKKLPSLWLSVFSMKHIDDEATEIICTELNITPANFWVIIHRSKVSLRACLQKNWIQNK